MGRDMIYPLPALSLELTASSVLPEVWASYKNPVSCGMGLCSSQNLENLITLLKGHSNDFTAHHLLNLGNP